MIPFLFELKSIDPRNNLIQQLQELVHFVQLWNSA